MEPGPQYKTLEVKRGLFLIKYEATESKGRPPSIHIAAELGSEDAVHILVPTDGDEPVLWSPGASVVVRASRAGRLSVKVVPAEINGSTSARLQFVTLSSDPGGARVNGPAEPLDLADFQLLGHVAGRGDVFVSANDWIGGPSAPARIEGIAIQWPGKPRDLMLRYAVTVGAPQPALGQFVEVGTYAGTRGRALPLVGATLEISGPVATGRHLVVDSLFLGSPQMTVVGSRVVLSGPTRREPLVGLRVSLQPVEASKSRLQFDRPAPVHFSQGPDEGEQSQQIGAVMNAETATADSKNAISAPDKKSGRVRVFRSHVKKQA